MASELERIAGRLRFLSDQAQRQRSPVVEVSQKLRDAASVVATIRFEQPEGPPITAPPSLAAHLNQAADRARDAVAPLTQTAELLRTFAARLAAGGTASTAGPGGSYPAPRAPVSDPPSAGSGPSGAVADRPAGVSSPPPASRGAGSVGPSGYGRYPTTTASSLAPGNRSYEVGSQPQ
ncbi:hypothetical protein [Cryptosporangium minutisporangium]|uniref:Uncharacterized protein n=1 Tax=Cryptosporangium minutisporangium TaxID=113569 RepID=A0ABP6T5S4_9ACTN